MKTTKTMESVVCAYITCALWASVDDNGDPLDDNYSCADIDDETLSTMRRQIIQFCHENADDLAEYMRFFPADYIGHDFWLSRNRHGAGFFDRCKID